METMLYWIELIDEEEENNTGFSKVALAGMMNEYLRDRMSENALDKIIEHGDIIAETISKELDRIDDAKIF